MTYTKFTLFAVVSESHRDATARIPPATNHTSMETFDNLFRGGT